MELEAVTGLGMDVIKGLSFELELDLVSLEGEVVEELGVAEGLTDDDDDDGMEILLLDEDD